MNIAYALLLVLASIVVILAIIAAIKNSDKRDKQQTNEGSRTMDGSNPPPGKDRPDKP